ncbi:MAG: A/G-specific adenine glycosylase [Clostridium sp.]|nr:A/G-specific adenine glycosylase [Clostridium sp.]
MPTENEFAQRLEAWYKANGRELPWRDTSDPYRIWISEIILQQTRVAQGYDYFVRFVERFPDVASLAEATEDEVLKYWQGLGYYSRARNLHYAAGQIVAEGGFPRTYDGIRRLKGVGDYTAAAIASFAFGLPCAVVDGNVYRVLSRYLDIDVPIDTTAGKKLFADLASHYLDDRQPALYNQAIMDFGALQCTPRSPRCVDCPLVGSCGALSSGRVDSLPVKSHVTRVSERYFVYIYIKVGGYTCLHRRGGKDIWKGLYEPLLLELDGVWSEERIAAHPLVAELLSEGGASLRPVRRGVRHQLSHRLLIADFYEMQLPGRPFGPLFVQAGMQWVPRVDVGLYAVPRLVSILWESADL